MHTVRILYVPPGSSILLSLWRSAGVLRILEAGGTVHDFGRNTAGANSFLPYIPFVTAWLQKRRAAQQARHRLTSSSNNSTTTNSSPSTKPSTSAGASAGARANTNGVHTKTPTANGSTLAATNGVPSTNGVHATQNGGGVENGKGLENGNGDGKTNGYAEGRQEGAALFLSLSKEDSRGAAVPTKSAVVAALAPNGDLEPEPHLTVHSPAFYWKVPTQ